MEKGFKLFTVSLIIILSGAIAYLLLKEKKVAFINTGEVFNEFKMTAEIDGELKNVQMSKQHILDSLAEVIRNFEKGIIKMDEKHYENLRQQYAHKTKQFSQEIATIKQSGIEKIWKQINQYVSDFSKEHHYQIVFGANGQGALMYADESIDITKEVSHYINEKFDGKK